MGGDIAHTNVYATAVRGENSGVVASDPVEGPQARDDINPWNCQTLRQQGAIHLLSQLQIQFERSSLVLLGVRHLNFRSERPARLM